LVPFLTYIGDAWSVYVICVGSGRVAERPFKHNMQWGKQSLAKAADAGLVKDL